MLWEKFKLIEKLQKLQNPFPSNFTQIPMPYCFLGVDNTVAECFPDKCVTLGSLYRYLFTAYFAQNLVYIS